MKNLFFALLILPASAFCQNAATSETSNPSQKVEATQSIDRSKDRRGLPVYLFNGSGSGSIIGFMDMGKFRKVRPDEYEELNVQQYAKELLENEEQFKTWIRIHYGAYCMAVN
jgi:hypothetical protein